MSNSKTATLTLRIDPSLKEALRIAAEHGASLHREHDRGPDSRLLRSNEALPSQTPKQRKARVGSRFSDQDG